MQFLLGAEIIKIVLLTQLLSLGFQVVKILSYYRDQPSVTYFYPFLLLKRNEEQ